MDTQCPCTETARGISDNHRCSQWRHTDKNILQIANRDSSRRGGAEQHTFTGISMERVSGREAITTMAEVDLGFRELSDHELVYVWKQAASFRDWLVSAHKKTLEEAKQICRDLYDKDVALLSEDDPYAEFIWSRGQEVGEAEIDLSTMADADPEGNADAQHASHTDYWSAMEITAERHVGKKSAEQWQRSTDKMIEISSFIHRLAAKYQNKLLTMHDMVYLSKVERKLDSYRFGRAPVLMFRHWAICHNLLVGITGVGKIHTLSVPDEDDETTPHTVEYQDDPEKQEF
jgi:hypothetical protein